MARVVYMGTPEFAVGPLRSLAQNYEVVQVYTQPDRPAGRGQKEVFSPVKTEALRLGLPVRQPTSLRPPAEVDFLKALRPEVVVVAAFGMILKKAILDIPSRGCINIHASLLPRWRGAAPIHHAILEGDTTTGISTMLMDEGLDTGDVLEMQSISIGERETVTQLHDRLANLGSQMILSTLSGWLSGQIARRAQSALPGVATYAKKITKDMQWLDGALSAQALERRVRALNPWPGTRVRLKASGDGLRIKKAKARADLTHSKTHQIIEKSGQIFLTTALGLLELETLQWDGRSEVSASEFVNGLGGRGLALPLEVISKTS